MVIKINKDLIYRKNFCQQFIYKELFKSFYKTPALSIEERYVNFLKFSKNFKKFTITKIQNHCLITQNTHSVYKCVKLSRHEFKKLVLNGQLPGCN